MNFESLKKKLKKILNPNRFRFIVVLYPDRNIVNDIKGHITNIYPESSKVDLDLSGKSYQDISQDLYKNNEGFVFINDFDEVLNNPDLYNGFNQRRDKIASFNINLICFTSVHHKEELFTKALNVIPDLWEFKNTVLELELEEKTDELSNFRILDSNYYSSLGGLTSSGKKTELSRLLKRLEKATYTAQQLNLLTQISRINTDLGCFNEALKNQKKMIKIQIDTFGTKNLKLASSFNSLALTYKYLGNLDEALKYQKKSFAINEAMLPPKHPTLAANYNNFATIYLTLNNLSEALIYQEKAVEIDEEVLNPNDLNLATSYNNLAWIHKELGRFADALKYQKKAIEINEKILDPKHPILGSNYNNLAIIYDELGKQEEALIYQKKAVEINEKVLDKIHPNLVSSYFNLAVLYFELHKYVLAEIYFQRSFDMVIFNKNHQDIIVYFDWLIKCLIKNKKYSQAQSELAKLKALKLGSENVKKVILKTESEIPPAPFKRSALTRNQKKRQNRKKK